jgi:predicted RNA binding protein YcfA (HicA-like mRNA interferase family)
MPPVRPIKRRDLIRYLSQLGFEGPFSGGKHQFVLRESLTVHVPNPHDGDIGVGLLLRILRQAGISREEWERL